MTWYSSPVMLQAGTLPANRRKISATCRLPAAYSCSAAPSQKKSSGSKRATRASTSFSQ